MAPTHYETLEITKESTNEEIKLAYKKLALIHHPDKNPENSEEATKRFKEISKAYEVLSDPAKKREYDEPDVIDDRDTMDFENLFRNFTMFFGPGRSFFASNYCHSSRSDSHNPKQPAKPKQTPRRTFMKSYSGGKQTTEVSFNHGENHIVEVLQNDVLRIRTTINIKAGNHLLEMFDDGKLVICTKLDFKNGKTTTKTFEHGILKAEF